MIIETTTLSPRQAGDVRRLTETCRAHDGICLSYPLQDADVRHYLWYTDPAGDIPAGPAALPTTLSATLSAVLAVIPYGDYGAAECVAFTLPGERQKGHFSALLEAALKTFGGRDLLFPVSGQCDATEAALTAIGAELDSRELAMELTIEPIASGSRPDPHADCCIPGPDSDTPEPTLLFTVLPSQDGEEGFSCIAARPDKPGDIIGYCQVSPSSGRCVCLHHVEILPQYRRHGYGTAMLGLLRSHLEGTGVSRMVLQVSGDNTAALALYKKTGFRVTEALSYYLY